MPVRLPFAELRNRVDENRLLFLVESKQSGGDLLTMLDRQFAMQFVSSMLGQGELPAQPDRDTLSSLEARLLLRWLTESLEGVAEPELWALVEIEPVNSERDLDAYHAQSPWWCEIWELKSESLRGRIELCGPWEFFSSLPEVSKGVVENEVQTDLEASESIPNEGTPDVSGQDQTSEI
jgi:flagellar motor switch protein FliM